MNKGDKKREERKAMDLIPHRKSSSIMFSIVVAVAAVVIIGKKREIEACKGAQLLYYWL